MKLGRLPVSRAAAPVLRRRPLRLRTLHPPVFGLRDGRLFRCRRAHLDDVVTVTVSAFAFEGRSL